LLSEDELRGEQAILARKLVTVLPKMGPTFIKLGQFLSTRPDLIGSAMSRELAHLQDKLPPAPFEEVKKIIEEELGSIAMHFAVINEQVVAAASVAQVYQAQTLDGSLVAIKVLRPMIEKRFRKDISLLFSLARILNFLHKPWARLKLIEIILNLEQMMRIELDLRMEASACAELSKNMASHASIYIPRVYWGLTRRRIFVMEWIDGTPIYNTEKLKAEAQDLVNITQKIALAFFYQVFYNGFFHADMHPGNILIMPDGRIALLDFGIVGVLNYEDRLFVAEIIYGFLQKDYERVAEIHFRAKYIPNDQSKVMFALACRSIGEPIVGKALNEIQIGQLLKQLFEVSATFNMPVQPQLLMLQKTVVNVEGIGHLLYPSINMWGLSEPLIRQWAEENFGISGKVRRLKHEAADLHRDLRALIKNTRYITANWPYRPGKRHSHQPQRRIFYALMGLNIMAMIGLLAYFLD
jgi:ubiquinone biosynthesis protein